jgi:hypothetical protein
MTTASPGALLRHLRHLALIGFIALLPVGVGGMVCQALTARPPEPPEANPQPKAVAEAKKPDAPQARLDRHGDSLPDGAVARLGTVRWRHGRLGGARDQVRRFLWLFDREWTEALLLPLKAVCRS